MIINLQDKFLTLANSPAIDKISRIPNSNSQSTPIPNVRRLREFCAMFSDMFFLWMYELHVYSSGIMIAVTSTDRHDDLC